MAEHKRIEKEAGDFSELTHEQAQSKSDFLSSMSHEMRTPINTILGMTAIGKKSISIVEKNNALTKIAEASAHLLDVINNVIDLAKIEEGKLELEQNEYSFGRMIQKAVNHSRSHLEKKEQTFSVKIDDKIPRFVVGDDQRLLQIITNLISNSVNFTPKNGNINLKALLINETKKNLELLIEITDSGVGISSSHQKELFQASGHAESGTSHEYGGAGLGLHISKNLVELMGGQIQVRSKAGKGTTFSFTCKLKRGENDHRSLLASDVNWENMRILAVDDMPEVREQFLDMFSMLDIKCDVAEDGLDALKIIEKHGGYDVYFIDWRMPRMDGIELTRKIKAQADRPSVVIMITAMDWEQIRSEATEAGVDRHMLKPLLSSTIVDCVNECLGKSFKKADDDNDAKGEFSGKHLLLTEDMKINREILISLLEDTEINIDCAENGQKALEMIEASPFKYDIVFMDIQMPIMDGHEATRRIRSLPALKACSLPIIATTANCFKKDIVECIKSGMDDHLGKPLDIEKVIEMLRKYLK